MRFKLLVCLLLISMFGHSQVYNIFRDVTPIYVPPTEGGGSYMPVNFASPALYNQNITGPWKTGFYDGFPTITYRSGNKMSIIYGHRYKHTYAIGNTMDELYSTDGGYTWTNKTVLSQPDGEVTNWAGGATRDGQTVVLIYKINTGPTDPGIPQGIFYKTSKDGGITYPISGTIPLFTPAGDDFYYGTLCEDGAGNLILPYYTLTENYTKSTVHLVRSTDRGLTWQQFSTIGAAESETLTLNEAAITWMGGGNMIAMIRQDQSEAFIPALIYNSTDTGHTWTKKGYLLDGNGNSFATGISPVLVKKNSNTVAAIITNRFGGDYGNNINIFDLNFGDSAGHGGVVLPLYMEREMGAYNIDEGYAGQLIFNSTDSSKWMFAYYQTSVNWSRSPDSAANRHIADILIAPMYLDSLVVAVSRAGSYANGAYPEMDNVIDQIYAYNPGTGARLFVKKGGNYAIDVQATFDSANTTGTFRNITVEDQLNNAYQSDAASFTQSNSQLTMTGTSPPVEILANHNLYVRIKHDATGPVNAKIKITIRKLFH